MIQCDAFQRDAFQNECVPGRAFQCDAFQLDAFQNDCEDLLATPARPRRTTVIVRLHGQRIRVIPFPEEEWEEERERQDMLARALVQDEELLLLS